MSAVGEKYAITLPFPQWADILGCIATSAAAYEVIQEFTEIYRLNRTREHLSLYNNILDQLNLRGLVEYPQVFKILMGEEQE